MRLLLIFPLLIMSLPGLARPENEKLPPVDFTQDTLSLPPAYFPELPETIRAWLEVRNYRIPQMNPAELDYPLQGKHNVVNGDFDGSGKEEDWAMIIFRTDTLKTYVFYESDTTEYEQLNIDGIPNTIKIPDWMESYGSFNLHLRKVDRQALNNTPRQQFMEISTNELHKLQPFTHDGLIIDQGGDMAPYPFTRYYHDGTWVLFKFY